MPLHRLKVLVLGVVAGMAPLPAMTAPPAQEALASCEEIAGLAKAAMAYRQSGHSLESMLSLLDQYWEQQEQPPDEETVASSQKMARDAYAFGKVMETPEDQAGMAIAFRDLQYNVCVLAPPARK